MATTRDVASDIGGSARCAKYTQQSNEVDAGGWVGRMKDEEHWRRR
jgi:hypothetical protein